SHVAPPSRADEPVRGPGRATTLSAQVHQVTRLDAETLAAVVASAPAAGPEPTADAELTALGEPAEPGGTLEEVLCARRSRRRYGRGGLSAGQLATVLEWTAGGVVTRGLRFYLVVKQVEGVAAGVYRYWPGRRSLEQTAPPPSRNELAEAVVGQSWVADAGCVLVLVAEAGELRGPLGARWYRTVHIGGGQAGERVYLVAEGLGLGTCAVGAFRDDAVARLLGLEEGVWPLLLYPVGR
ncbi:MAG: SagB/ThcOx family dehydrogenase, partial [Planctomycetes bacterium]|nr:SagB/ThcOx family dehydrogenase [Planctomycetota bacterium]